jgi:hypothetical protein
VTVTLEVTVTFLLGEMLFEQLGPMVAAQCKEKINFCARLRKIYDGSFFTKTSNNLHGWSIFRC